MPHHMSGKSKAAWLIISGAILGGSMYAMIGGVGIVLLGMGIGIKLPEFILIGIGLILVSYGTYRIGRTVERWHQDHSRPPSVSKDPI
jgi:hypothetical protein